MTYRFEITADTLTELAGKALALAAQLNATAAPAEAAPAIPAADAAPAARRKPKAAPAPEPVETAEEVVQPDPEPAPVEEIEVVEAEVVEPAAVEAAISYEKDIMPGVVEVVTKRGKPVMAEILAQFGAAKASHIDPDQYPELLAAIRDALASAA